MWGGMTKTGSILGQNGGNPFRDYNLRFYNVPETVEEDCITKLHNLLENDQKIGIHRDDGFPCPILVKFSHRAERFKCVKKKRDLHNNV